MSINEVKYSILDIILICLLNSFISNDEFIIADPLSVSGGNQNILIINFAGDIDLANNIYNYFISNSIIKEKIEITIEEDNIVLSLFNEQDKKVIKQIRSLLQEYLDSFKIYKNHKINELENILTVGIPKDIVEISNLVFCEICGYGMSSEEELLVHRRSHGIL
ncbi:MAG: hypothetical protein ACXWE0_01985 [Nitrososphaeraceae archaeon]